MEGLTIMLALLVLVLGGAIFFLYQRITNLKEEKTAKPLSELEAIEKASDIAKQKILEAEKKALEIEKDLKASIEEERKRLKEQEKILQDREKKLLERNKILDEKLDSLEKTEQEIEKERSLIKARLSEVDNLLEKTAQLTKEEAQDQLKAKIEKDLSDWTIKKIKEYENEIKEKSQEKSRQILIETILNSAVDFVADTTTTIVDIKDESMKSRIIGKSGRNIRTFERLTGVDVIIDESPTEVTISSFDPIRREVAAIAMQRLVSTGKINPAEIEDTIEKVKKDILKEIKEIGEEIASDAGFPDIPNEIIMLLGRYRFRFSFGQNLVKHTAEVIKAVDHLCLELNVKSDNVKLAALLHDIGKVVPSEGKSYQEVSREIVQKFFKFNNELIEILTALEKEDSDNIYAEIIRTADLISSNRPGAKKDTYDEYVKRIRSLEDIANSFEGVSESFAIRAGKEVRVMVKPSTIDDENTKLLAYKIAQKIEHEQPQAGPVKVSVIRENRAESEAK
ncbi:MAG: ribonuclease Y [Candidatus Dojkabacteria bacterium]